MTKDPKPEPPRIHISRPLMSILRTLLFPSRQREALVQLVAMEKCDEDKNKYRERLKVIFEGESTPSSDTFVSRRQSKRDRQHQKWLTLGFLLHFACKYDHPRYFEKVLRMVERSNIQLTESHYNGILNAMNKYKWNTNAKKTFRDMQSSGVKCRLEAIFALVISAVKRKDFTFAEELMTILTTRMYSRERAPPRPFPMEVVVDGCVGAKRKAMGTVEQVLEWHRMTEVALSSRTVNSLTKWVRRSVHLVSVV